jgi:hypothetical protein
MCGKRRAFLSLQVGNDGEHYEPALDSDGANIPSISWWIGPAYHAGGECFDRLAEVVRRESFSAHCGRVASDWSAGCMLSRVTFSSKADLVRVVRSIDDTADRLGLLEGGSPAWRAAERAGLHKRMTCREDSGCEEARKTGDTARVGAGVCWRFTLARESGGAP